MAQAALLCYTSAIILGSVLEEPMLKRRPLLVTPWTIWIKPKMRINYRDVHFWIENGTVERGRIRVMITDEMDRAYWVRLNPR